MPDQPIPGPRSRALAAQLAVYEPPGVTYLGDDYPVFWERASGALIGDVDGNTYLDLTSAFGVAAVGHTNPHVVAAIEAQARRLVHGMGDVHPTEVRVALLRRLAELAPGDLSKTYLATSGAEAIEFALKTALLATGKPRVVAYDGAYHGLSLGALEVAGIPKFRDPFAPLVVDRATFLRYPGARTSLDDAVAEVRRALDARSDVGALLIEPIQGRGGVIVPPEGYLRSLRALCDERGVLLILDEIYTGFGRTGTLFASEREGVVPDLLCVGKALGGGVPISATIGASRVMDAWPRSTGEALHTSTFLGNPLACAAALATLDEIARLDVCARVNARAAALGERLAALRRFAHVRDVRGRGFLWAIEFSDGGFANRVVVRGLQDGVILLQSGPTGTSITIAPPLTIDDEQLAEALARLERAMQQTEEAS
ncbi:aspartate aminotransferase family protein [Vulcanimicrobium alpinum]|uniref:Aspartate aminotransferase family protein n=1 Tax=Vulcanimicrobium alpinum TaxID=3016050 RepID=A0AAN1XVT2_UNVUL|nr:aspartate aminotransferase family protein [Vulcanimicrobium alpinum]BDE06332.1 aspartate aminotransferase family protein [Vulcanimicrobium alpinum]